MQQLRDMINQDSFCNYLTIKLVLTLAIITIAIGAFIPRTPVEITVLIFAYLLFDYGDKMWLHYLWKNQALLILTEWEAEEEEDDDDEKEEEDEVDELDKKSN